MPDLTTLLDHYRPEGDAEAADVRRVRALLETTGDPYQRNLPLHITASALIVHPSSRRTLLRWLTLTEARDTTSEPNLREALARLKPLLAR